MYLHILICSSGVELYVEDDSATAVSDFKYNNKFFFFES